MLVDNKEGSERPCFYTLLETNDGTVQENVSELALIFSRENKAAIVK